MTELLRNHAADALHQHSEARRKQHAAAAAQEEQEKKEMQAAAAAPIPDDMVRSDSSSYQESPANSSNVNSEATAGTRNPCPVQTLPSPTLPASFDHAPLKCELDVYPQPAASSSLKRKAPDNEPVFANQFAFDIDELSGFFLNGQATQSPGYYSDNAPQMVVSPCREL